METEMDLEDQELRLSRLERQVLQELYSHWIRKREEKEGKREREGRKEEKGGGEGRRGVRVSSSAKPFW